MSARSLVLTLLGGSLLAACNPDLDITLGPSSDSLPAWTISDGPHLAVMSRNMYIGANVDQVIAALASPDPADDFPALLHAISVFTETDFPSRARALADEIARARPHVVGLQEVTRLDIDLTGFGLPFVIHQDFISVLLDELRHRGLRYEVVALNASIQAAPLPGLSLVDHDALLIDAKRVAASGIVKQNFALNIGVVAPGVEIKRGWVAADVLVEGTAYRIVNTHLESGNTPGIDQLRAAQSLELVSVLGASPAILLGDFNDLAGSVMYQVLAGAGFNDVWSAIRPSQPGLTCCHFANLANERPVFSQRIDYVFARGVGPLVDGKASISLIGADRRDRIAGPAHALWPSDHAGLVARFQVPRL